MRFRRTVLPALLIGAAGVFSACGSGGIEFNGQDLSGKINPRTTPIVHFPMPSEAYNPAVLAYHLDNQTIVLGRPVGSSQSGQPVWSEPVTAPLPLTSTVFSFKSGTEVWEIMGSDSTDTLVPPGNPWYLGQRERAMSATCQWLVQQVNGDRRTDTPIVFENIEFESVDISVVGIASGLTSPRAGSSTARQNPVSDKIGAIGNLLPNEEVGTDNLNYLLATVQMPGTGNTIDWRAPALAPPVVLFGKWQESKGENLFIESNYSVFPISPPNLVAAPVSGFFSRNGRQDLTGGLYISRMLEVDDVFAIYDPNLSLAWYYSGVCQTHIVGLGMGLESIAFTRPGLSNGEEDIMNVNVEIDQTFYATAGRRFQFTSEGLLHMQHTLRLPLASQERADAELLSLQNPFSRQGARMIETAPGPLR